MLVPKEPAYLQTLTRMDQSDSDGSFSLRDLVPGQYTIVAIEDGWDLDWSQPEVMAGYLAKGAAVTVAETGSVPVALAEAVKVQPR
jgi:hypothetical protein